MQGIERSYADVCVAALIGAWRHLMNISAVEALQKVPYGKGDTLGLDAVPEIVISDRLRAFDQHAILVTEESGEVERRRWPTDSDRIRQPLMFFSDPTDRSKFLKLLIEHLATEKPTAKIGKLLAREDIIGIWERIGGAPASITGPTSSITCVRKGAIIFSVILNYVTGTIFVASPGGVHYLNLPSYFDPALEKIDFETVLSRGEELNFPSTRILCPNVDDCRRFVTFLGKSGYKENFTDSHIFVEGSDGFLHHSEPGGPSRPLYLSQLQQEHSPVGFVMANGEKISEWIHWLAFVKFARTNQNGPALRLFEISLERPWTKDGMLMSTSGPYSLFVGDGSEAYLDISRLRNYHNPSKFRSMLVVTPYDNELVVHIMRQYRYREVTGSF